jgi:hypothetical protein
MTAMLTPFALADVGGRAAPLMRPAGTGDDRTDRAAQHEAVVAAARRGAVLPLGRGVIWDATADAFLAASQPMLRAALARAADAVEIVVTLTIPAAPQPAARTGRDFLRAVSADASHRAAGHDSIRRTADGITRLARNIDAIVSTPPGGASPRMLGVLVRRADAAGLAARIEAQLTGADIAADLSGPWPPYLYAAGVLAGSPLAIAELGRAA